MKFRNFEKIGLTTEKEIKEFLSCPWLDKLARDEALENELLNDHLHEMGLEGQVKSEMVVSLLNRMSNTGYSLLCLLEVGVCDNEIKVFVETTDGVFRVGYPIEFNNMEEALEFTDKLYGAESNDNVRDKITQLQLKFQGEAE